MLKGIGSCECCGSRVASQRSELRPQSLLRYGMFSSAFPNWEIFLRRSQSQIRAKHVSRVRPVLPCHRHCRPYFCCSTTAYAFAERRLAVFSGWVATTRSMPPTATALTFLEMLARFSLRRHRKADSYRAPGRFHDHRLLDEQRPPESRPYLTTRSYGSTKGPRSAHIGLGRAAPTKETI